MERPKAVIEKPKKLKVQWFEVGAIWVDTFQKLFIQAVGWSQDMDDLVFYMEEDDPNAVIRNWCYVIPIEDPSEGSKTLKRSYDSDPLMGTLRNAKLPKGFGEVL